MSESIIKKYKILAKKSLGQNFLVNEDITTEISGLIKVLGKNIIEVGPWYGALTEKLLGQKPDSLHLVELDRDMIEILEHRIIQQDLLTTDIDFRIHNTDVLEFIPKFQSYSVIANIPYYITSPILRRFLYELEYKPEHMIILMQKDVWDKILWKGKQKSSVLSLMIEKKCDVSEELFVGKENFIPAPKIESSVLKLTVHEKYGEIDDDKFLEIIKIGFSAPRKKLMKNFITWGFGKEVIWGYFEKNDFDENLRGEDLGVEEWCSLVDYLR